MTTSPRLAAPPKAPRVFDAVNDSRSTVVSGRRVGRLAVAAPLLLFASGILAWVDGVLRLGGTVTPTPKSPLDYAAGSLSMTATALLVAGIAAFAWLAVEALRHPELSRRLRLGHLAVAVVGVVLVALPFDLLPLGALLLLLGLAPLLHDSQPGTDLG